MNIMPNEVQKMVYGYVLIGFLFTIPSWEGSTGALMAMSLLDIPIQISSVCPGAQGYKSMFRQSLYGISILFDGKKDMESM